MQLSQLSHMQREPCCRCYSHASASTSQPVKLTPRERKLAAKRLQRERERQQRKTQRPMQQPQLGTTHSGVLDAALPAASTLAKVAAPPPLVIAQNGQAARTPSALADVDNSPLVSPSELSHMASDAQRDYLLSLAPQQLVSLVMSLVANCAAQLRSSHQPSATSETLQPLAASVAEALLGVMPSLEQQQLADVAWSLAHFESHRSTGRVNHCDASDHSTVGSKSNSTTSAITTIDTSSGDGLPASSSSSAQDVQGFTSSPNAASGHHQSDGSSMAARCMGPLSAPFHAAMNVPFLVLPRALGLPLQLEQFVEEVDLAREMIQLSPGSAPVPESRLTAWQCDCGAPFRYSGKEMRPPPGGMTPRVAQVRDVLHELTGQLFDGVLVNYYEDGKCGMRFHSDPLEDGAWTPNTAVVSLGATRQFVFRGMPGSADAALRWHYQVSNGDVVLMWDDCQARLQHSIKVERSAGDAGPRMSLVFKQRARHRTAS